MATKKPVLFSGIQPTGRLHVGNYLGALKNFVDLQNTGKYDCFFSVVDLHSLTGDYTPKEKTGQIPNTAADFIAAGIDPKKSVLFQQSQVPAHSELAWILNTITPMGELERMTQFKDKSDRQKENVNVGLFTYPVLMAADILLYDTRFVPVGDDQLQHLELARTLARKFNNRFGRTFIEPQSILTKTPRVMSLQNPNKKMSKSDPAGCLFVDDSPADIESKIRRAVTDSGSEVRHDWEAKPGISNMLEIMSGLTGEPIRKLEIKFAGKGYGVFKSAVAAAVAEHFADFRKRKQDLLRDHKKIMRLLAAGTKPARAASEKKMVEVRHKIGLAS